jgi:hypothetical protein
MTATLGPGIPPELRPILGEVLEGLREIAAPKSPTALFACPAAALPPASAWRQCLLLVSDLNILAHSDGIHWIRQDTGGAI